MLDIKLIRQKPTWVEAQLARKGYKADLEAFSQSVGIINQKKAEIEGFQHQRNHISKEIGQAKASQAPTEALLQKAAQINAQLQKAEKALIDLQGAEQHTLEAAVLHFPNIPSEQTPDGKGEADNVCIRQWGEPKNKEKLGFEPKDHVALGGRFMDFEVAARLSGSRFVVLYDKFARLHRALTQFMLDIHTLQHGYQEVYVPYLVLREALIGTGQLPKFEEDLFSMKEEDLWLIPTSEVAVTNLVREQILSQTELPIKYVCHSPCFRREAGTYGKDMRGMIRQHQFEKVEMVQIVSPEHSYEALEEMLGHAEKILQLLNLPYRVMNLCAGDLGFSAAKTYDLEVWLPGQDQYREISSCSNTEAFQARRMQARYRKTDTQKPEYVHTLNGSGLAVGRTLIAVIENYQDKEGHIHIPPVLQPYMGGVTVL